ncbi:MAG: ACP S-malonyltransferase [Octadecabacter sp.]|nr:ACP S-malonyltransferase [Octadecabacter sp.]
MKKTAVVVAPGRGTYNKTELGYLNTHHSNNMNLISQFDDYRSERGQKTVSDLDGAARFSGPTHTRGDNASPLIYACAYNDFLSIDRDEIDILAVTGNSMGWYIALACAGALTPMGGLEVVNTMGTLMQESLIGGQLIYPFVDDEWAPVQTQRHEIETKITEIDKRPGAVLSVSIHLGGMFVLAGNEAGLSAFETEMPRLQGRFPMRLPNHAAFHSKLQNPVASKGREELSKNLFLQPDLPLVDGCGAIWNPDACNLGDLYDYTLGHQISETYDFTKAIQTAAFEFMPDMFIVLGPGSTLGGATAQSLLLANWRNISTKTEFKIAQSAQPLLASMRIPEQRKTSNSNLEP